MPVFTDAFGEACLALAPPGEEITRSRRWNITSPLVSGVAFV
jgi:hypothetical protein